MQATISNTQTKCCVKSGL